MTTALLGDLIAARDVDHFERTLDDPRIGQAPLWQYCFCLPRGFLTMRPIAKQGIA